MIALKLHFVPTIPLFHIYKMLCSFGEIPHFQFVIEIRLPCSTFSCVSFSVTTAFGRQVPDREHLSYYQQSESGFLFEPLGARPPDLFCSTPAG